MKPCSQNRKDIALLAVNELETRRARELRAHLADCADCRRYLEEMESVAGTLRAAEPESNEAPSASFHRNVMAALAAERRSLWKMRLARVGSFFDGPWALPAGATLALVLVVWFVTAPRASKPLAARVAAAPDLQADLAPTFANYEWAAHQSLEKLDELLKEEGEKSPSPAVVYTNSWLPSLSLAE